MDQCEKGIISLEQTVPNEYLSDYAELAAYLSVNPNFQVYRWFNWLSTRNLLYLQSEMAELEQWFDQNDREELERRGKASEDEKVRIICRNQSWSTAVALAHAGCKSDASDKAKREATRMGKIKRLRLVTAEYRCKFWPHALVNVADSYSEEALIRHNECLLIDQLGETALRILG